MSERMWLRATCLLVVLFASPGLAAAGMLSRMSGPFRVQIGIDGTGAPVYSDCGQLNFYKTATGREWRLEDTCNQLIDLMVPTVTPTPLITPTPTPVIGNTPTPGGTGTADCPDGFLAQANSTQWVMNNISLQLDRPTTYCVDLPASTRPFFEVKTVNLGNSSCSNLEMTVISPQGTQYFSNGSQPGVPPLSVAGRWKIELLLTEGCNRYNLSVLF
jgi:hypothetical protein